MVVYDFKLRPCPLECVDVEVVSPKFDHALLKLTLAVDGTENGRLTQGRNKLAVIGIEQQTRVRGQCIGQCAEPQGENGVFGQTFRAKLLLNIRCQAHSGNPHRVAGTWPVSGPVQ